MNGKHWMAFVWLGGLLTFSHPAQAAEPEVRVVARSPATDTLAPGDSLYLKVHYQSSQPLRFQLNAEGPGQDKAGAMMNASPVYPAGSGEAMVWIAFRQPFEPQQLVLRVADDRWRTLQEIPLNDNARWLAGQPSAGPRADWADSLGQQQQRQISEAMQQAYAPDGNGSASPWDWLLALMAWSVPGYFILQAWIWHRWQDGWRRAGLLPLWASIPITGYTLFAILMGSNLWPLVMLFAMPVLFLYLACLFFIRLISHAADIH